MVELEPWEELAEIARKYVYTTIVNVSRDIVDYFTDLAKATDRMEMGGFLLGKHKIVKGILVVQLYDYIQQPNVSPEPETSYQFPTGSYSEIKRLIKEGRYSIATWLHTHPDDSYFSVADICYHCLTFRERLKDIFSPIDPREIPAFLVTGGEIGYVMTYTGVYSYMLRYSSGDVEAILVFPIYRPKSSSQYVINLPEKMKERFPDYEVCHECADQLYYTSIKVSRLEKLVPSPTPAPAPVKMSISDLINVLRDDLGQAITEGKFDIARLLDKLISMLQRREIDKEKIHEILFELQGLGYSMEKVSIIIESLRI